MDILVNPQQMEDDFKTKVKMLHLTHAFELRQSVTNKNINLEGTLKWVDWGKNPNISLFQIGIKQINV